MDRLFVSAFALGFGVLAAAAQTAPETPPPSAAAPSAQSAPVVPTGREVRAQCRAEAQAKGLKGTERKAAVQDCFAKARPDLAKREQCRQQGKSQGLGDIPLRQFIKQCVNKA
jgi:hypothetical protein